MASALQQPARQLGNGGQPTTPGAGQSPFNFDLNQLLAMLLSAEQQKQQQLITAAQTPVSPIARDPRARRAPGLAGWYEMNPHAQPGQTYAQSQQSQQQGLRRDAAMQDVQQRVGLAELLQQLESLNVQSLDNSITPRSALPYNPFFS